MYRYDRKTDLNLVKILGSSNGTGYVITTKLPQRDSKAGTAVPSFRKKISRNINASSEYYREVERFEELRAPYGRGISMLSLQSTIFGSGYCVPQGGIVYPPVNVLEDSLLIADLYSALQESRQAVQSLPFMYEYSKTKQMIGERASSLYDSVFNMRKKIISMYHKYRYGKRSLKHAFQNFMNDSGQVYLEYKFGWAPTFHDIASGYKELTEGDRMMIPSIRVANQYDSKTGVVGIREVAGAVFYKRCTDQYSTRRIRYTVGFYPEIIGQAERFGYNERDIPGLIWEELPWSWLADYFLDIQTFLTQFQYCNLNYKYITKSVKQRSISVCRISPDTSVPSQSQHSVGTTKRTAIKYDRYILTNLPFYWPQLNLAGPFKGSREWNLVALAGTRFKPFGKERRP